MEEKKSKKGTVIKIIVLIAVFLVVAGAATLWIIVTPGYLTRELAVSNYFIAISEEDRELYKNTCYCGKWQKGYVNNEAKEDLDTAVDLAFQFQSGATYGKVEVTALEKLDKSYADKMEEAVKSLYGTDIKVSAVSKVNFEVKTNFEGEKDSSGTITRYTYRSGGKWYFLADPETIVLMDLEG